MHLSLLGFCEKVPIGWELNDRYFYRITLEAEKSMITVLCDLMSSKGQVLDMPSGCRRDEELSEVPGRTQSAPTAPLPSIIMLGRGVSGSKLCTISITTHQNS